MLGGTFNPVHCAHIRLAEAARDQLGLDPVLFVLAARPPLKQEDVAPVEDRLAMLRLAVDERPGLAVSDIEVRRSGPSYTVDTLAELSAAYPDAELWFLLGSDALQELDAWHQPERLWELANMAVVVRDGPEHRTLEDLLPKRFRSAFRMTPEGALHESGRELRPITFEPMPVASRVLRKCIRRGEPIREQVPEPVADYIDRNCLYQEES